MEEIICAGTVADIAQFARALAFPDNTLFLAEEFPQHVISKPAERKKLMRFDFLHRVSDEERKRFTSGRIFTKDAELRWEKKNENSYYVVYFGPSIELDGMNKSSQQVISTDDYDQKTKSYYLFGKHLDEKQRERLEIPEPDKAFTGGLYAEARIPRLLQYPWTTPPTGKQERVQLEVLEYREKATAEVTFYRFQDVKPGGNSNESL